MLNDNMLVGTNSSKKYERVKYDIVKIRSYPPDGAAVIGEVLDCHYSFSAFVSSSSFHLEVDQADIIGECLC